jgi:hypothetical protein
VSPALRRAARWLTWGTTSAAVALTAHTAVNLQLLRRPAPAAAAPGEPVSVLVPLRDEAHRVAPTLRALLVALRACGPLAELVVLDDGSTDATADVVRDLLVSAPDLRTRLVTGVDRPEGWLGKTWACDQLRRAADPASRVLVLVDADVVLAPLGLVATVDLLRRSGLDLVSPYPRQLAVTLAERLVQPLLQWSWATTLPLRLAERSPRPSLAAANGQLMALDAAALDRAGGFAAVRGEVLDDVALVRAVKARGGRGGVADGTDLATCRMYEGWADLRAGWTKSLWSAFGSPAGATGAAGSMALVYVWPLLAGLVGSPVGWIGYGAGVLGRVLTGRRTGGRVWPDALAHPASVLALGWLTADSWRGRRRGTLRWKGRPVG